MTLKLYYHPLSSFCQKTLVALYENDTAFEPVLVDFADTASREAFLELWPIGRFPVLVDDGRDQFVPESSIIIEYLDQHYPGKTKFIPADADVARQMRMRDRFFDLYVNVQMQKVVTDRIRPPDGNKDPYGVEQARGTLKVALDLVDEAMSKKTWAMGDDFTMADCAAAPALSYANQVRPFAESHPNAFAYLGRLSKRPSFARALKEAEPYWANFPKA
ncbi:MAG: glutathione S-transferase family protein [Alphaproteobacteria bacterium]|nr:glutathione S-transferase family protein [Alphaproteobacteria bacterium]